MDIWRHDLAGRGPNYSVLYLLQLGARDPVLAVIWAEDIIGEVTEIRPDLSASLSI